VTEEEFEEYSTANSGMTPERLREFGFYVEPCDCGAPDCLGWAWNWSMSKAAREIQEQALRGRAQRQAADDLTALSEELGLYDEPGGST